MTKAQRNDRVPTAADWDWWWNEIERPGWLRRVDDWWHREWTIVLKAIVIALCFIVIRAIECS